MLSEEEKSAIEILKNERSNLYVLKQTKFITCTVEQAEAKSEAIETVLNMLKEKDKEIEKKDKIIDLMAEQLAGLTIWNNEKEEPLVLYDKEEVKKYFERKVEDVKNKR